MNLNIHIERLVLDGLPIERHQGPVVQAAVEAELAQLLREGGLDSSLQSSGAVPGMNAAAIHLASKSNPTQIGQQIARAVYGGLRP